MAFVVLVNVQKGPTGDDPPDSTALALIREARAYVDTSKVHLAYAALRDSGAACRPLRQLARQCDEVILVQARQSEMPDNIEVVVRVRRRMTDTMMREEDKLPSPPKICGFADHHSTWRACRKGSFRGDDGIASALREHYKAHMSAANPP